MTGTAQVRYYNRHHGDSWVCAGPAGCGEVVTSLPEHDHDPRHADVHEHNQYCAPSDTGNTGEVT
jgi:hypothetical protein